MNNWLLQYFEVLAAYLVIMFVWPSIIFRKYLQNKSVAFRFAFCTTGMVLLLNTVILLLGLVHLLNPWVVRLLFYGVPGWYAVCWLRRNRGIFLPVKHMMTGICSPKWLITQYGERIAARLRTVMGDLWRRIRPRIWEYIVLAAVVVYGMLYFGHNALQTPSYGTSDTYVHHSWIYQLLQGNVFSAGVYPEGMHCFIYGMHILLGVDVYHGLVFLQPIHMLSVLAAAYLFLREMFSWKFSGFFVLVLYLVMNLDAVSQVGSMARLQWALPQEFSYNAMFLCVAALVRFLRGEPRMCRIGGKFSICRDENLMLFAMAMAVTVICHFYTVVLTFFLCAGVGIYYIRSAFVKKQVIPILCAVLCGVLVAFLPMAGALATGIPFQGSIDWALEVIEDSREELRQDDEETGLGSDEVPHWTVQVEAEILGVPVEELMQEEEKTWIQNFYDETYGALYAEGRAPFMAIMMGVAAAVGLAGCGISLARRRFGGVFRAGRNYLGIVTALLIYLLLYGGDDVGVIALVERARLCSVIHLLFLYAVMVPADILFSGLRRKIADMPMQAVSAVCCAVICAVTIGLGHYHGFLYYSMTRYDAAVSTTADIIRSMKPQSFTIVSVVDELYQVIDHGFHEEQVLFVNSIEEETYTLPTEYVFCFVEKQPLFYHQSHFISGPAWLGNNRYYDMFLADGSAGTLDSEVGHTEISAEEAARDVYLPIHSDVYKDSYRRTVLQSRMYAWCQRFMEVYPDTMQVVYEDDAFVCYGFRQNPARLLELAITD